MSIRVKGRSRVIEILLTAALAASGTLPVFASETHQFDVPSEDAPSAIRDFASQAHVQILVAGENVKDKHLHAVSGEFSTDQGLRLLLADSGLAPKYVGDRSIAIVAANANSTLPASGDGSAGKGDKKDSFRLAQANQGTAQSASTVGSDAQSSSESSNSLSQLTEVVVTAEKKTERVQDVPIPVTVLDAEELASTGQTQLRDYFSSVPGLSVAPNYLGQERISMRGITVGDSNPTVGITIDDVPYTGSTDALNNGNAPDVDPGDLARVEVLRGPQGTLYGANSMGGLIKYVTKDPSTDSFSARVQAGTSGVYHGDQPGFDWRAAVNVPVDSTFAMRLSAYAYEIPGFIDNPVYHLTDVNSSNAEGGTLLGLWRPSDSTSLKFTVTYQHRQADGSDEAVIAPGLGDLQQNYLPGSQQIASTLEGFSAVFKTQMGPINLTSVTGLNQNHLDITFDRSYQVGSLIGGYYKVDNSNGFQKQFFTQRAVSEELRLTGTVFENLDWLVGGFFTYESQPLGNVQLWGYNDAGAFINNPPFYNFNALTPDYFREDAGFANLTYRFTDQFDVQVGGRMSFDRSYVGGSTIGGPFATVVYNTNLEISPAYGANTTAFTYLFTPRLKLTPDLMVYARLASGFRPGGGNVVGGPGVPSSYNADKNEDYELGLKGDFLDHRISLDASVYYIDWSHIQITVTPQIFGYITNGGDAKSQGVEFSASVRPLEGLTVGGWVSYDDAVLTQNLPATASIYGAAGDRLPQTSRYSGNLMLEQDFMVFDGRTGYVGGQASYVGDRLGIFQSDASTSRQYLGGYARVDLNAGVRGDTWDAKLYVINAGDRRGVINGGVGYHPPDAFAIIQPRTIGITLTHTF